MVSEQAVSIKFPNYFGCLRVNLSRIFARCPVQPELELGSATWDRQKKRETVFAMKKKNWSLPSVCHLGYESRSIKSP